MKGISSGVAVILLIIITIILTGITLMFISNQFPDPTATAANQAAGIEMSASVQVNETDLALEIIRNATFNKTWTSGIAGYERRYNCADFAADSVLALRENNFTAYPMCGLYNGAEHAWVGIEINGILYQIEPQAPKFIENNTYNYLYAKRCVERGVV